MEPHEAERPRKRLRTKTPAEQATGHGGDICKPRARCGTASGTPEQESQENAVHFFRLECLGDECSPDPRMKLEIEVRQLAKLIRDDPTLPADAIDSSKPSEEALLEDAAVQLPAKHCAFRGCAWSGESDRCLIEHFSTQHLSALSSVASLYPLFHSEVERMSAAYNAALSAKSREVSTKSPPCNR